MKQINIEDIQIIIDHYNKTKGMFSFFFRDSDEIIQIKKLIKSFYNTGLTNIADTNKKRNLSSQELIDLYRLLINIQKTEDVNSLKIITQILDLFYPEEVEPRTKINEYHSDRFFENVFRALDKCGFFSNPKYFINLRELIAAKNHWEFFYFHFRVELYYVKPIYIKTTPLDVLHSYSSIDSNMKLEDYYYEVVRSVWMLKQLNMLTPHNIDILKNICKPKAIPYLSDMIELCIKTHDNLLFNKWHYNIYVEGHYKCIMDYVKTLRKRWLAGLFDTYKLIIKCQNNPDIDIYKIVNFFVSSLKEFRYSYSQINIIKSYSKILKELFDKDLLSPDLIVVILNHPEPDFLLKILIQLNKKEFSGSELYLLSNFNSSVGTDQYLVPLFYATLDKQEIIKNSRILFQGYTSVEDNLFQTLPPEILIKIVQLTATNLDKKSANKVAIRNFNRPIGSYRQFATSSFKSDDKELVFEAVMPCGKIIRSSAPASSSDNVSYRARGLR